MTAAAVPAFGGSGLFAFRRAASALLLFGLGQAAVVAQERIPPAPRNHFNDYAGAVTPSTAAELNARLAAFERETSSQIIVAIFPRMESSSSVEDYTVRVAQAWGVGSAGRDNGAVLFAFLEERQVYIQVGYGLEGVLPDALANRIIEDEIVPRLRAGDFDGGFRAGVAALLAAARGEYQGTGRTLAERGGSGRDGVGLGVIILMLVLISLSRTLRRGALYSPRGRRTMWPGGSPWIGGRGGGGFGGGTFRGGGGSFGGGGAGGRW